MFPVMSPTSPITATVAQRVVAAMEATGATVKGLAHDSGVPRSTLQRRLLGRSSFTVDELDAICDALGITLSELLPAEDVA